MILLNNIKASLKITILVMNKIRMNLVLLLSKNIKSKIFLSYYFQQKINLGARFILQRFFKLLTLDDIHYNCRSHTVTDKLCLMIDLLVLDESRYLEKIKTYTFKIRKFKSISSFYLQIFYPKKYNKT